MKLRTLIVDDEPIALEKLQSYVGKTPMLTLRGTCSNGIDAMNFLMENEVDLIITDINMPDLNGMDMMKSMSNSPMVIFTTAYDRYAVESYKLSAVDYLLKPYGYSDFLQAINKALSRFSPQKDDTSLFVKVDYRYVRIPLESIRYIKGYGEYLQIYVGDNSSPLLTLSSFAAIKCHLTENFLQVHRSYIVNMDAIEVIERNRIYIDKETIIPVGDSYKTLFQSYINSHSVGTGGKSGH